MHDGFEFSTVYGVNPVSMSVIEMLRQPPLTKIELCCGLYFYGAPQDGIATVVQHRPLPQ